MSDTPRLLGRDGAIRLVREFMTRPEVNGTFQNRSTPVVLFVGSRGSGKSALLAELASRFRQQVPYALVDFERAGDADSWSVLAQVALQLAGHAGFYRRLSFPRLTLGLLAIDGDGEALNRLDGSESVRRVVLASVSALGEAPTNSFELIARLLTDRRLRGPFGMRAQRRALAWYAGKGPARGEDGYVALRNLGAEVAARGSDARRGTGQLAWEAFLADLRDDFSHGSAVGRRSLNCAVMFDNADLSSGAEVIGLLNAARRAGTDSEPDPVTVIATARSSQRFTIAEPAADLRSPRWQDGAGFADAVIDGRDQPVFPVRLRNLTEEEVRALLGPVPTRSDGRLISTVIHRLSDGNPAAARIMLDAFVEAEQAGRDVDPRRILDIPTVAAPSASTVSEQILKRLLPQLPAASRSTLTSWSAARTWEDAAGLARSAGHSQTSDLLYGPDVWSLDPVEPAATMRPEIRWPLLCRLADAPAAADLGWEATFLALERQSTARGDLAGLLYYSLARGEIRTVVDELGGRLPNMRPDEWLLLLRSVVEAPSRPEADLSSRDLLDRLTADFVHARRPLPDLARVVAGLWIAANPLVNGGDVAVLRAVAAGFESIAEFAAFAAPLLDAAARTRSRAARE